MAKRTYGQYCALARAFDVLGERWTPLLLRELAIGPRRYADLLEGLPGVSPSLLTQRLRELEEDGIVQRSFLPPPAARAVYELTDDGVQLATSLVPLARWGARRLGSRREGEDDEEPDPGHAHRKDENDGQCGAGDPEQVDVPGHPSAGGDATGVAECRFSESAQGSRRQRRV